ncbi:hypothetical protein LTR73_009192, partial [Friedmanniomyces endolithicus]
LARVAQTARNACYYDLPLYEDSDLANKDLRTASNDAQVALAAYVHSDNAVVPNGGRKRKAANIGIGAVIRELRLTREEQATQSETLLAAIEALAAAVSERPAPQRRRYC